MVIDAVLVKGYYYSGLLLLFFGYYCQNIQINPLKQASKPSISQLITLHYCLFTTLRHPSSIILSLHTHTNPSPPQPLQQMFPLSNNPSKKPTKQPSIHQHQPGSRKQITDQELSQLCSSSSIQNKSSSKLLFMTKKSGNLKLDNTRAKRQVGGSNTNNGNFLSQHNRNDKALQPFIFTSSLSTSTMRKTLKLTSSNNNNPNKLTLHTQKTSSLQQQQMNLLYEQNQKLGYRINYLNDENNFYRISINNIEKLNSSIHKHLDGRQVAQGVRNKIDTKMVGGGKGLHELQGGKEQGKGSMHSLGQQTQPTLRKQSMSRFNYSVNGPRQLLPLTHDPSKHPSSSTPSPITLQAPTPTIGSSFSMISNKIHLKNLQMKVGNSIRKTEKLKKIYEGSISSLTKKAEQLEMEINKLAREAEYYEIEAELLRNIYKADYYLQLNYQWVEGLEEQEQGEGQGVKRGMQESRNPKYPQYPSPYTYHHASDLSSLKQVLQQDDYYSPTPDPLLSSQDSLYPNPKQPSTPHQQRQSHGSRKGNKMSGMHQSLGQQNFQNFIGGNNGNSGQRRNLLVKEVGVETFPMAVRFLSGQFNYLRGGSGGKNNWYSALYATTSSNFNSNNNHNFNSNNRHRPWNPNNNPKASQLYTHPSEHPSYDDPNQPPSSSDNPASSPASSTPTPQMTPKQLFLLPSPLITYIITSLQKQQIQQLNKLQSLRKQQKQQKKTNHQLVERIQQLTGDKHRLKELIEQEFALFFVSSVNTMEMVSKGGGGSGGNTNGTIAGKTLAVGYGSTAKLKTNKARTLHRTSSTQKLAPSSTTPTPSPSTPTPWTSIQQRKQQADQLYLCTLYQKQLLQSLLKQDKLLQQQYKINQQYKQKIIDRNQQQNKELKVLQEEVNKCMQQVKEVKFKYRAICEVKGKSVGSTGSVPEEKVGVGRGKGVGSGLGGGGNGVGVGSGNRFGGGGQQ